jgi:hypothetical protein
VHQRDNVRSYHGDQQLRPRSDANADLAGVASQMSALERALAANPSFSPAISPASATSAHDGLAVQVAALDKRRAAALATAKTY